MKSIIAKFDCYNVEEAGTSEVASLSAVTANCEENRQWSEATPSGSLSITISNPDAKGVLIAGKQYLITIAQVEE